MSIADIIRMAHRQLRLDDLVPLNEEWYERYAMEQYSFDEWKEIMEANGYDTSRFYLTTTEQTMNRFFYVGEYATLGYPTVATSWMTGEMTKQQAQGMDGHYRKLFESGNYEMYFFPEGNSFAVDYFIRHYDRLPEERRFELFADLYLFLESGFTEFPESLVEEIIRQAPSAESRKQIAEKWKTKKGMVTIYRGEITGSTPLVRAMSWTLSIKVAKFFAGRTNPKGVVYRAQVPLDKVIHYIGDRNEEEVWVKFKDLEQVKRLK